MPADLSNIGIKLLAPYPKIGNRHTNTVILIQGNTMKKTFSSIALLLLINTSLAVEIQFIGPCSSQTLLSAMIPYVSNGNVGALTLQTLDNHHIAYQGTPAGLNQAFETPIGLDAIEVISDKEMLAYGWCYEVDGVVPEIFPNAYIIGPQTKVITWFFGYAHYLNGEWIGQCLKAYLRHSSQLCS